MITTKFDYVAPATLDEAVKHLASNPQARAIAGGQGLLHSMKRKDSDVALLVDLGKVGGLRGMTVEKDSLRIGAMTTLAELLDAPAARDQFGALGDAIAAVGDPQVRNRATLGGCLAEAHPAGDLTAPILALEAVIHATGPKGERGIPADEFFVDGGGTSLKHDEVITAITIPYPAAATGSAYVKAKNPASGYALCGVAAAVTRDAKGVTKCRVAVTGAGDHAKRLKNVEATLEGEAANADAITLAAAAAAKENLKYTSDLGASADYRAHLTIVLAERALTEALKRGK